MTKYYIGQTFTDTYNPEASLWCNANNAFIEKNDDGYIIKEVPPPTLEQQKARKLAEITAAHQAYAQTATVEHNGRKFSIHDEAQQNLTSAMMMASTLGTNIQYFCKDGEVLNLPLAEFVPYGAAIGQGINARKAKFFALEAAIKAATTVKELEAIRWSDTA